MPRAGNKKKPKNNNNNNNQRNNNQRGEITVKQLTKLIQQTNSRVANLYSIIEGRSGTTSRQLYKQKKQKNQNVLAQKSNIKMSDGTLNAQGAIVGSKNSKEEGSTQLRISTTHAGGKSNLSQLFGQAQVHILHPSNFYLFPTLDGIWQHYQKYVIKSMSYEANPTCSLVQGGNFLVTTITPQQRLQLSLPTFSDLINFATTNLWPVAKHFIGPVASSILQRAKSYLMQNPNTSLQSPGSLIIANNLSNVGSQASNPLITFDTQIRMDQFKPYVQKTIDQDKIAYVTSSMSAGSSLDYYPYFSVVAPQGIDVSLTTYPSTAAVPLPPSLQGWQVEPTRNAAILIQNYVGKIRVQMILSSTTQIPGPIPQLQWLNANKKNNSNKLLEMKVNQNNSDIRSYLFFCNGTGVLYLPGFGAMVHPFQSNMTLWPTVLFAIQFEADPSAIQVYKLAKYLKKNQYKVPIQLRNRVRSLDQINQQLYSNIQKNPGPQFDSRGNKKHRAKDKIKKCSKKNRQYYKLEMVYLNTSQISQLISRGSFVSLQSGM